MLTGAHAGVGGAEFGLAEGVTGLGGPAGTGLGLRGCEGIQRETAEEEDEEDVVTETPNFGEAMSMGMWLGVEGTVDGMVDIH